MPVGPLPLRSVKMRLQAAGLTEASQKDCTVKFVKQSGTLILAAIVPKHQAIAVGTLRSILRQHCA